MNQTEENILIALIAGIISFFIGLFVGRKNLRYQNFLRASEEFRSAFQDTIIYLDEDSDFKDSYTDRDLAGGHIETNIAKHKIAYKKFLPYLGWINTIRIKSAWQQYEHPDYKKYPKDWNVKERFEYAEGIDWIKQAEIRKLLRKRINKLLKFAKVK
jgi:hypothetical protein